jgi:hypothetical protein
MEHQMTFEQIIIWPDDKRGKQWFLIWNVSFGQRTQIYLQFENVLVFVLTNPKLDNIFKIVQNNNWINDTVLIELIILF